MNAILRELELNSADEKEEGSTEATTEEKTEEATSAIKKLKAENAAMKKESVAFINRIKEKVLSVEPQAKIILYGSRAKGTARSDSDWDVLILLAYQKITLEIEKKVVDPLYELEFETGEVISPMVYAEQEWNTKYSVTPFYANVNKEGIPL